MECIVLLQAICIDEIIRLNHSPRWNYSLGFLLESNYFYALRIFDKVVNIYEILHLNDIFPRWNSSSWINIDYW